MVRGVATGDAPRLRRSSVAPGDWRMAADPRQRTTGGGGYLLGHDGSYQAFAIVVLTVNVVGIARIAVFGDPGLFTKFGFPALR